MLGAVVGNYRITARIGEGGMGAVYLARHTLIGRQAAIKVLAPAFCNDSDKIERFFHEARAVSRLHDPAIVEIFDFGYDSDHSAYVIMEYLEGESVRARLDKRGPMSLSDALDIAREVARALAPVHAQGIAHRHLTPASLFLVPNPELPGAERVKILDFGITALLEYTPLAGATPYAAPEQRHAATPGDIDDTDDDLDAGDGDAPGDAPGDTIDHRADFHALGAILFEMLAGTAPVPGDPASPSGGVPALRAAVPAVPVRTETVIAKLLSPIPEGRFADAAALGRALDAAARDALGRTGPNKTLSVGSTAPSVSFAPSKPATEPAPEPAPRPATGPGPRPAPEAGRASADRASATGLSARRRDIAVAPWPPAAGTAGARAGSSGRRGFAIAAAVVVAALSALAVAAALGWLPGQRGASVPSPARGELAPPTSVTSVTAPTAPASGTAAHPDARAPADTGPAADPPPVALDVEVAIRSQPPGAEVLRMPSRERVGTTPWRARLPVADGELVFILRRRGYHDEEIAVPADTGGEVFVELRRQ